MNPQPPSKAWLSRLRQLDTRKGREEENRFLAEGWKIVDECFTAGLACQGLLVSDPEFEGEDWNRLMGAHESALGSEVFTLSDSQFKKVASTQAPQGILGVFDRPDQPTLEVLEHIRGIVVVLDEVQDPGNVGTAIRCAAGLGAEAVALAEGCADIWNPKTLRATAGSLFRLPVVAPVHSVALSMALVEKGFEVWIADSQGAPVGTMTARPEKLAIVFGNESRGPGSLWERLPGAKKVGLPLARGVESLNVGAAVAALLAALYV